MPTFPIPSPTQFLLHISRMGAAGPVWSQCQTATSIPPHSASSRDVWADRGAGELHNGAPRSCKLPMMFILQAAKHFVEGSFMQTLFKIAFIDKIAFSHLHILQTVWQGSCRNPTCRSPAQLPPALALLDGHDGANAVSMAPEHVYVIAVRGTAARGSFCPDQTFLSTL